MPRIVKTAEARRAEILEVARRLFAQHGFSATSVEAIVAATGVAKGTFYYYFRTKEDLLDALVQQTADVLEARGIEIARDPALGPVEKLRMIFRMQRQVLSGGDRILDHLHLPQNREIHERSHVALVIRLGPLLAEAVAEGVKVGIFKVEDPVSTVQFILAGAAFLFDEQAFDWTPDQQGARLKAMVTLAERALGASPGMLESMLTDAIQAA